MRRARAHTQEELAERAGISVSFLSMIERAERVPHLTTLAMLANAFGVTLSELFVGVNERPNGNLQTLLPLVSYLANLRLDSRDVDALVLVAKTMFEERT